MIDIKDLREVSNHGWPIADDAADEIERLENINEDLLAALFMMQGMTLRDYFAAKAMQGLVPTIRGHGCAEWTYYSEAAYKIADAMIEERKK
jgi:hypothetical protein